MGLTASLRGLTGLNGICICMTFAVLFCGFGGISVSLAGFMGKNAIFCSCKLAILQKFIDIEEIVMYNLIICTREYFRIKQT